jgi:hypothetical protein
VKGGGVVVFNATFNNISVLSWLSFLLLSVVNNLRWLVIVRFVDINRIVEELDARKRTIRIHKSTKDRQHNGQKKKDKQRSTKHYTRQKTKTHNVVSSKPHLSRQVMGFMLHGFSFLSSVVFCRSLFVLFLLAIVLSVLRRLVPTLQSCLLGRTKYGKVMLAYVLIFLWSIILGD